MSKTKDSIAAPPVAARRPFAVTTHGDTRVDDYVWLRDRDNPSAIAYLEEENRYLNESRGCPQRCRTLSTALRPAPTS